MTGRDWLQAVIRVTNVPSLKPTLLSMPISLVDCLLLEPFGHFGLEIPLSLIFLKQAESHFVICCCLLVLDLIVLFIKHFPHCFVIQIWDKLCL